MSETTWAELRRLLLSDYADLIKRLSRRLGSTDQASDALQDTFLRIERGGEVGPVFNHRAYLLRMALNLARSRQRAERRRLSVNEGARILEEFDDSPGPDRVVAGRFEVAALLAALSRLPERRRAIFLAAWSEDLPHSQIAERYGVTLRTVQLELKAAAEQCAELLNMTTQTDFAPPRRRTSWR